MGYNKKNKIYRISSSRHTDSSCFVFQNKDGVWELIDGLQRLSTIFEFLGILKEEDDKIFPPSILVHCIS